MAKKAKYAKQSDIPEADRADYKEKDGAWLLEVEGGRPLGFVEETEFNRVKDESEGRKKTINAYKAAAPDADPDKLKADLAEYAELKKGAGNIDVAVAAATARMKTELDSEKAAKLSLQGQLSGLLLDNRFKDEAAKAGVRPEAIKYLVDAARSAFEVKDGELVPRNSTLGKDGKPLSPGEWVGERKVDSPFFFQGASGGGAGDGASKVPGGDGSKPNPFKAGPHFNRTSQGVMQLENPTEAARMKAEAAATT